MSCQSCWAGTAFFFVLASWRGLGDLSPIWQPCVVASKGVLRRCAWRSLSLVSTGLDDKVTAVLVILPIKVTAIVVGWPSKVKAIVVSSFLLLQQ